MLSPQSSLLAPWFRLSVRSSPPTLDPFPAPSSPPGRSLQLPAVVRAGLFCLRGHPLWQDVSIDSSLLVPELGQEVHATPCGPESPARVPAAGVGGGGRGQPASAPCPRPLRARGSRMWSPRSRGA